ncbi:hypothetical protein OGAPHI_001208 [Ogataea philodendri]|uniref:L-type lectin-like domain-containing protein n=1 Tax=Ogataea philodendri TaxID=1378263 RepID=A0A9P8PEA8_9ASCO|nr:uncharacterized protein OGAPHI_001208 [Ogataea philodendri]KAH3670693.1 hypothetical protein OGAPHI_001208 [Ogataea philodendri]
MNSSKEKSIGWSEFVWLFVFLQHCAAHSGHALSSEESSSVVNQLSFPDLVNVKSLADLQSTWQYSGEIEVDEGRVVLTPTPSIASKNQEGLYQGAIWSRNTVQSDSFSVHLTLRSIGSYGPTGAGFSFWLIDSNPGSDASNFGGPAQYSGLQITLDANDIDLGPVLRVYLNDGSKKIDISNDYLGAYTHSFQDSQVPSTLKVAYEKNWLKITCDNKLLFETTAINLDSILKNAKIGLTASAPKNIQKTEQFEVFMFKFFNTVISSMKVDPSESLFAKHQNGPVIKSDKTLTAAEMQKIQEKLRKKLAAKSASNTDSSSITEQLVKLENLIKQQSTPHVLQKQLFDVSKSVKALTDKHNTINSQMEKQYQALLKQTDELNSKYDSLKQLISRQNQLLELVDDRFVSFNTHFQGQSQNHQSINDKLNKLQDYYSQTNRGTNYESDFESKFNKFTSAVRFILMPVVGLLIVMTLLVYKLRNDIKHAKGNPFTKDHCLLSVFSPFKGKRTSLLFSDDDPMLWIPRVDTESEVPSPLRICFVFVVWCSTSSVLEDRWYEGTLLIEFSKIPSLAVIPWPTRRVG